MWRKPKQAWQLKVDFGDLPESGKDVLQLTDVSVGYGRLVLLRDLTLSMRHGERIALIGENGTGKSTLIKTIIGQLLPLQGSVRLGVNVRVGYFAQEQDVLDPNATPLESLQAIVPWSETEARSFLHHFLLAGDQPLLPNRLLSYGERARLMLALLVAQGCNFLILDEPINHLDIPSRTQFETALTNFEGTVLAVVHDRYFIQGFASRIWAVESDRVQEYFDLEEVSHAAEQEFDLLSVNGVFKFFADQVILQDISFVVSPGERVGLIGPNGSGKTTLLRLIADEDQPDRGSVFIDPHTRVGYLRQGLEYPIGCTLADALHDPRVDAAAEVERLAMASSFDPLHLPEYQAALDQLEALGGYPDQSAR